jgi:hypothetical protein
VKRKVLGWLLILHGLAHVGPGMWASDRAPILLVTLLWVVTLAGLLGGGFGLLGVEVFKRHPRGLVLAGLAGSVPLLVIFGHSFALPGALIDLVLLALVLHWEGWPVPAALPITHRRRHFIATVFAWVVLAYLGALVLLRPWYMNWGATSRDREAALPGDAAIAEPHYRIDHVIRIAAPADAVWPWLVQIGQDRGGFYSHAWLENLVGANIHNADRIVPEWQQRAVGDLVRAVPPTWLGGRLGRELGWRVVELVPGRAIVLEGWGAFVVVPEDSVTTRLHIRTRGDGTPRLAGVFMAPFGLAVFEPAHFIMERAMLRGVRARAERDT